MFLNIVNSFVRKKIYLLTYLPSFLPCLLACLLACLPNLDFLKAVSVTMIAISEKMKMRKSHLILVFPTDFLKNFSPPTQFYGNFILLFKKRSGNGMG